jgi:ABC-type lipoprotein release transport system permease subunit
MKEDLKIAWRNLWRNKRRTMLTSASVFFAVFFAVIMRSYQLGSYDRMIQNFIESYSGYLQVQQKDYQENPSVDYSFDYSDSFFTKILSVKNVVSAAPHIESFALASSGNQTKGVIVLAVDTEKEKKFSNPESKLVRYRFSEKVITKLRNSGKLPEEVLKKAASISGNAYSSRSRLELDLGLSDEQAERIIPLILEESSVTNQYLSEIDTGVLVSDRLASYLKLSTGDTLILMGQGYHGSSAAGLFPVRGIIKMPSPDIDNKLVIMTILAAQKFLQTEGKITSLAINLTGRSTRVLSGTKGKITDILTDKSIVVKTWEDLNPVLVQQINGDSQTGMATLAMLYFIIFFGIFGTVLMMMAERTREFGVLISLGMQKRRLKRILSAEMIIMGSLGLAAGMAAAAPFIIYFYYHPILLTGDLAKMMDDYGWDAVMPAAWFGPYFYWQALIVFMMVLAAIIYPLRKISKLKEVEALRS